MKPFGSLELGLALIVLTGAVPRALSAQADDADAIVVTGSRTGLQPAQIGSAVTVVSAADIEANQALLVKDILQDVPGVELSNDRPGAVTSVYLRGTDNDQVLVLLDGMELGDPSNISTQFQFDHLDTGNIERIEVLRGNQSSLYGSDAIGGVINIITRRPRGEELELEADAEAGSFGLARADLAVAADRGLIDYRLGTNTLSADGPSRADPLAGPAGEADAYDRTGFNGRLGFQFTPNFRLELAGLTSSTETDLDGTGQDATATPRIDKDESAYQLSLTREDASGRFRHELGISRYDAARLYPESGDRLAGRKENFRYSSVFNPSELVSVAAGLDLERERTDQFTGFSGSFLAEDSTDSVFAELALVPTADLTLTLAARGDDNERFGRFETYRLTVAQSLGFEGPDAKLRASWGTGAKAPGLYQLFDPSFGNTGLGVEESKGYDVGIDLVWAGGARLEVSYFANRIGNEIDFLWPVGYLNLGATRARGVEAFASMRLGAKLDGSVSYTYLDAYDTQTGAWLGRPRDSASLKLVYSASERLSLSARARYRSENAASYGGTTDSFVAVDLLGSYALNNRLEVYGRLVNLFDADYEYEWGSSTYGRSAFAGVRVRY